MDKKCKRGGFLGELKAKIAGVISSLSNYITREELMAIIRKDGTLAVPVYRGLHDVGKTYVSLDVVKDISGYEWVAKKVVLAGVPLVEGEFWHKKRNEVKTKAELTVSLGQAHNSIFVLEDKNTYVFDAGRHAENDGILVVNGWVLQIKGIVTVDTLGGVKDSTANQDTYVQKAINYAVAKNLPILNDFHEYKTSATLNIPSTLNQVKGKPLNIKIDIDKIDKAVFVGDSLTEKRTGNGSYATEVVKFLAHKAGGFKEVGNVPFSSFHTKEVEGMTFSRSPNILNMWGESDGHWGEVPFKYSPDGKGLYIDAGDGTDFIAVNFAERLAYDKLRIYYAKQAGGGSFDVSFIGESALSSTHIETDGEGVGFIDVDATNMGSGNIRLLNITGKVAVLRFAPLNDGQIDGFAYDVFARSGIRLEDFIKLDSVSTSLYYEHLKPDVVFINLGTNDANGLIPTATFKNNLIEYIRRIHAGYADAKIVLIEPNQPDWYWANGQNGTLIREYSVVRKELALANGYGYFHTPSVIGGYGELAAVGGMVDNTHPTLKGKKIIANALVDYLDMNTVGGASDYIKTPTKLQTRFPFTDRGGQDTITQGVPKILAKIGLNFHLVNTVSSSVYVELDVVMTNYGALTSHKVMFFLLKDSTLPRGKVKSLRGVVITEGAKYLNFTGTVTVELNADNEVEIKGSPDNFNATTWSVSGYSMAVSYNQNPIYDIL